MGLVSLQFQGAQGGIVTTITAPLTSVATNAVGVVSTDGFKDAGLLVIRNEVIRYTGKADAGDCPVPIPIGSPCFTGLTRMMGGSVGGSYPTGSKLYDSVAGYANLGMQYAVLEVENSQENVGRVTMNPLTWIAMINHVISADKEFLTGQWHLIMIPWYAFTGAFLFALALALAGMVRTFFSR